MWGYCDDKGDRLNKQIWLPVSHFESGVKSTSGKIVIVRKTNNQF